MKPNTISPAVGSPPPTVREEVDSVARKSPLSASVISIELSWPAKELSPNARVHHMVKHRYAKAAKTEAGWATKIVRPFDWGHEGPLSVHIIASPPKNWNTGDNDNLIARLKSHFDGIAEVLGVNDRQFQAPTVEWADKTERGRVVVTIGREG